MRMRDLMMIVETTTTPASKLIRAFHTQLQAAGLSNIEVRLEPVQQEPETCSLETIWNHGTPGQGDAAKAMRVLTGLADRFGVTLEGYVHYLRYDTEYEPDDAEVERLERLNAVYFTNKQLLDWYIRHGFTVTSVASDDDNKYIIRRPKVHQLTG